MTDSSKRLKETFANWREKRDSYERELSITSSPALKFELKKQIEECNTQIDLLEQRLKESEDNLHSVQSTGWVSSHSQVNRKILVLSANPRGTSPLRISEEVREIRNGLKLSKQGCHLSIESVEAVRYRDISQAILEYEPDIVHFSGHGSGRDGLLFEDNEGYIKEVSSEALAGLFELFSNQIECVVLNACYSEIQAKAIARHIRHVVGMSDSVGDKAAIEFSISFYNALGSGRSYDFAYKLGCQAIAISGNQLEFLTPCILGTNHTSYREENQSTVFPSSDVSANSTASVSSIQTEDFDIEVVELDNQGQVIERQTVQARRFYQDIGHTLDLELVYVPGGDFLMGSIESEEGHKRNESPQHSVEVSSFYISRFPITQKQWYKIATLPQVNIPLNKVRPKFQGENLPMEGVSWHEAIEFCARLSQYTGKNYKLPSEAQWEYACRARTETRFHFGDSISTLFSNFKEIESCNSNLDDAFRDSTTPISFFGISNSFGLSDMHGNVFEWCADSWHENYEQAPLDGSVWNQGGQEYRRVIRGGAHNHKRNDCRSAARYYLDPNRRTGFVVGLRVTIQ